MSWAAANLPKGESSDDPSKESRIRKRGETIEAALSRLSKSYSTAMECIGSMHSLNTTMLKQKRKSSSGDDGSQNYPQTLRKVAKAGRDILEQAVLLDPLVLAHAPALRATMQQYAARRQPCDTRGDNRWMSLCKPRPDPPQISSKAHRSTIRQLAYLALTNYSDLLMAASTGNNQAGSAGSDLLGRGVVKKLEGFTRDSESSGPWWEDSGEDVQRLALVALCDAATLDGSDPVVWLKLACAARALWLIQQQSAVDNSDEHQLNPFRRLERHALESGFVALPPHIPPNRALTFALDGLMASDAEGPSVFRQVSAQTSLQRHTLNLDLTRYSWSLLGRALIRAFREGEATEAMTQGQTAQQDQHVVPFGSPTISLSISPMLLLPSSVLTKMLSYLEEKSVRRLEATCRALSYSIMAVRATLEKQFARNEDASSESPVDPMNLDVSKEEDKQETLEDQSKEILGAETTSSMNNIELPEKPLQEDTNSNTEASTKAMPSEESQEEQSQAKPVEDREMEGSTAGKTDEGNHTLPQQEAEAEPAKDTNMDMEVPAKQDHSDETQEEQTPAKKLGAVSEPLKDMESNMQVSADVKRPGETKEEQAQQQVEHEKESTKDADSTMEVAEEEKHAEEKAPQELDSEKGPSKEIESNMEVAGKEKLSEATQEEQARHESEPEKKPSKDTDSTKEGPAEEKPSEDEAANKLDPEEPSRDMDRTKEATEEERPSAGKAPSNLDPETEPSKDMDNAMEVPKEEKPSEGKTSSNLDPEKETAKDMDSTKEVPAKEKPSEREAPNCWDPEKEHSKDMDSTKERPAEELSEEKAPNKVQSEKGPLRDVDSTMEDAREDKPSEGKAPNKLDPEEPSRDMDSTTKVTKEDKNSGETQAGQAQQQVEPKPKPSVGTRQVSPEESASMATQEEPHVAANKLGPKKDPSKDINSNMEASTDKNPSEHIKDGQAQHQNASEPKSSGDTDQVPSGEKTSKEFQAGYPQQPQQMVSEDNISAGEKLSEEAQPAQQKHEVKRSTEQPQQQTQHLDPEQQSSEGKVLTNETSSGEAQKEQTQQQENPEETTTKLYGEEEMQQEQVEPSEDKQGKQAEEPRGEPEKESLGQAAEEPRLVCQTGEESNKDVEMKTSLDQTDDVEMENGEEKLHTGDNVAEDVEMNDSEAHAGDVEMEDSEDKKSDKRLPRCEGPNNESSNNENKNDNSEAPGKDSAPDTTVAQSSEAGNATETSSTTPAAPAVRRRTATQSRAKTEVPARVSRSSRRVRSQQISSDKRDERRRRRKSVSFCLRAATLSCTVENDTPRDVGGLVDWDRVRGEAWQLPSTLDYNPLQMFKGKQNATEESRQTFEAEERVGSTSLSAFLGQLTARKGRPVELLQQYLAHVAINVEGVFQVDPGDNMVLTTTLKGCFELLSQHKFVNAIIPSFFEEEKRSRYALSMEEKLELLAADVLHAELRFKTCERQQHVVAVDFESDSNFVSSMIPVLLRGLSDLKDEIKGTEWERDWWKLQARVNWLVAGVYLWRSRITSSVAESIDIVEQALEFIDSTKACLDVPLDDPLSELATPHLVSPGRVGAHWKELSKGSLTAYKEEIEASSLISQAQHQFQERVALVAQRSKNEGQPVLDDGDIPAFAAIFRTLTERYGADFEKDGGKHRELLDNLMSVCRDASTSQPVSGAEEHDNPQFDGIDAIIPVGSFDPERLSKMSNPSILTILVACLQVIPGKQLEVVWTLTRLALCALDRYAQLCQSHVNDKQTQLQSSDEGQSDSEDVDSTDMEAEGGSPHQSGMRETSGDALKVGRVAVHVLQKLRQAVGNLPSEEAKKQVACAGDFLRMLHHSLGFCSRWASDFVRQPSALEERIDRDVFVSTRDLVHSFFDTSTDMDSLKELYVCGVTRVITSAQACFASLVRVQGIRARRSVRQRICIQRAEFIGVLLCEVARLLSEDLCQLRGRNLVRSKLLEGEVYAAPVAESNVGGPVPVFALCESMLWFCSYSGDGTDDAATSFDRPIIDCLRVPLAAAIVSLCGSGSQTRQYDARHLLKKKNRDSYVEEEPNPDRLSLTHFLDSDASIHDYSEKEEEMPDQAEGSKSELLRVACHIVHCVAIVFGRIDEKEIVACDLDPYKTKHGPLLPLVITRVLNHVAEILLGEFADSESESDNQGLWAHQYPFATGTIGLLLDSALYKAYKCLHGFTLVGGSEFYSSKEHVKTSSTDIDIVKCAPESHHAAAQLYRCILRSGKKPPRTAFETVSSALPPLEETKKSKALRSFLFSSEWKDFDVKYIKPIVKKESNWQSHFEGAGQFLCDDEPEDEVREADDATVNEIDVVRKGLLTQLATGDLPAFSNEFGARDEDQSSEQALSRKFFAILDTLCFGDSFCVRGWFRASQCLMLKSNFIADRLGLSLGFARNENFIIPEQRPSVTRLSVDAIEEKQNQELRIAERDWIPFLPRDLSLYVQQDWSSIESLRSLSKRASMAGSVADEACRRVERELFDRHDKDRLVDWQRSWGGMFASALQKMAIRCMCMSIYIFHEEVERMDPEDKELMPEIFEALGTTFYASLMASQSYGYPMHVMPKKRKRDLADAARVCFQHAVEVEREMDSETETWDLNFMIGKCHEKIAGTYKQEKYASAEECSCRLFEVHMKAALSAYRASLDEEPGDSGEAGGSSHGRLEIVYRLHASRLKCLIEAALANRDERGQADIEALRITEEHSFSTAEKDPSKPTSIRGRVWNVLTDIVSALAQCRLDHTFFHRSVYRHAQALMWAPVLNDPTFGWVVGSKGTLPPTKSCQLRGLNHATNVAKSALAVMSVLFEKKRSQLVAVWVTTSFPPTAFETLNNSVRKYDSLRGKYVSAYSECLRLCQSRNELETLLRWVASSKRDLPAGFQRSLFTKEKPHTRDSLLLNRSIASLNFLTGIKRITNSAMAHVLKQELSAEKASGSVEDQLKLAYACYLRLNCTVSELTKTHAWKYKPGSFWEVEALCSAYQKLKKGNVAIDDPMDWSGGGQREQLLGAALKRCKEMFPSVTATFFSKKSLNKSKAERRGSGSKDPNQLAGKKRSFEVKVPANLGAGETFTTTIMAGETAKKVKLTVPDGEPETLRFSIDESNDMMEK